ncbi:MAG: hypothetical protein GY746_01680, partial [Gammaproteobacteria bacterium]|nr:hypothetical protein [Gammaproteobacteria bacterium]
VAQAQAQMQAAGEVVIGILWEPADWAVTFNYWRQGEFHWTDLAGLLPFIPASGVRALRHSDKFAATIRYYVRSNSDVIPAKAYRYISSQAPYLDDLLNNGTIPANTKGTYISFDRIDDASDAAARMQVPHDAAIRLEFDTLQITEDVRVPHGQWGTASHFEPLTVDFPQFGIGRATQAVTNKQIKVQQIMDLRSGEVLYGR